MRIAVLADVDMVKGGVNVGLMVTTLASERNDIACCKHRSIEQKHYKCRKYFKRLVCHLHSTFSFTFYPYVHPYLGVAQRQVLAFNLRRLALGLDYDCNFRLFIRYKYT